MYAQNQFRARNEFSDFCCDFIDPGIPTVVCEDFNTLIDLSTGLVKGELFGPPIIF